MHVTRSSRRRHHDRDDRDDRDDRAGVFFVFFSRVMTWTTAVVARRDFLGFFYRPRLDRSWGALFSYFTDRDAVCVCVYVIEKRRPERFFPRSVPRGAEMM